MSNSVIGAPGPSMRLNTKTSQPRTSSNRSFQEQFRDGFRGGVDAASSALGRVVRGVPGGAMLSSALSDAARNIGGPQGLSAAGGDLMGATSTGEGFDSIEKRVADLQQLRYEQQLRVGEITASWTAKSNILKAFLETLKGIGKNI